MKVERELDLVRMTPDDVIAAIRDGYRFSEALDPESEPGVDLTMSSTVAEWRNACDLVGTRPLGRALNTWFGVNATDTEWRAVLEPPRRVTLGLVCALIVAKGATRPVARAIRLAGAECAAAAQFLAIRSLLAGKGLAGSTLRPSTSLGTLPATGFSALVTFMGRLAPGVMPVPKEVPSLAERITGAVLGVSLLALMFAGVVDVPWYPSACFVGVLTGIVGIHASVRYAPGRFEFANDATLGTLARAAASHRAPPT
jgi:hypothetical protein